MRVLYVTPYVPSRIRVRPFQFIKALAASHEVSLVALLCDAYEREMAQDVAAYCASVDLVSLPKWRAYSNCLLALPTLTPLRVAYYQSSAFTRRILQVIRERNIDVVHGELIKVVPSLRAVLAQERIPVVYDSVDCISSYLSQQWSSARKPLQKTFVYTELKKMQRYEPRSLTKFDAVVITSAHDRNILTNLGELPEHITVVPNGVDTDYFTPPIGPRETNSLVFCAKMDYYPNAQAMLSFCQEVLPRIWERRPDVRLTIVGNNPPPFVYALAVDPRITVTGFVPDIRPYLAKASVALAPLLVAAGMQNKILEALAMGTPMVATPGSCRSLQTKHETHLLVAEGTQMYADAILRLLEDTQFATVLSEAGRTYVEQYHSWTASANILKEIYQKAIVTQTRQEQTLVDAALAL
ncbi:MAG: glycosyltransferase [Ktedonobacteraceae bacterium]